MNSQSDMTPQAQGLVKCAPETDAPQIAAQNPEDRKRFGDRYRRLFPFVIAAAAGFIVLRCDHTAGIGHLIYLILLIALQIIVIFRYGPEGGLSRRTKLLMAALLLTGVQLCTTSSWPLITVDVRLTEFLFLLIILSIYRSEPGSTGAQLKKFIRTLFYPLIRLIDVFTGLSFLIRQKNEAENERAKQTAKSILLGLLILICLLLVILPLLANADLVFGSFLSKIQLPEITFNEVWGHIIAFLTAFVVLTAWWIYLPLDKGKTAQPDKAGRPKPGPAAAVTYLAPISVIYTVFTIISVRYILIGGALPDGITYAEYVHQGFYQLLAVTIINLILIAVTRSVFAESRSIRFFLCLLCVLTYGMIWNGTYRMILYIRAYQLTFLRLAVCFFFLLLTVFITFLLITLLRGNFPLLRASAAAAITLYLLFAFMHPDAVIAKYNMQAEKPDTDYISSLSLDAVPVLAEDPDLLEECYGQYISSEDGSQISILDYNFSEARAKKIINKNR